MSKCQTENKAGKGTEIWVEGGRGAGQVAVENDVTREGVSVNT